MALRLLHLPLRSIPPLLLLLKPKLRLVSLSLRRSLSRMPADKKRPLPDSVDPSAKRPKNLEKQDDPNTAAPSSGTALGPGAKGKGKDPVEEDWFKGNICSSLPSTLLPLTLDAVDM